MSVGTRPVEMGLFRLQTARGRWLVAGAGGRVEMADAPAGGLVLCVPAGGPQTSFLIAPNGASIEVEGDGLAGPAISVRLRRVAGGRVELRHPLAPVRHLGVVFGAPGARPERVLFDRIGDPRLDRLDLHPVGEEVLGGPGRALLAGLAGVAHPPMAADIVLGRLRTGTLRPGLAEAVIRVLPADELQALARRLMECPADLAMLRRAMPTDPWLGGALPALVDFLAAGRPPTRRAVSPAAEDHVSVLQSGALRPQAGLALTALARRTVSPRRVAAVLAAARNEGPYLLDWLAHHRAIGFEHAVIYSNDNDDGSDALLGLLADAGVIGWVRNDLRQGAMPQWKVYGHAFKVLPDLVDYRWTMVLDLDEYFSLEPAMFGSVADFVGWHEHQGVDAIALRWLTFTASREDVWHDAPSTQRFTRRDPAVSSLFKSLVRSNQFWDSHCHFPFPAMDLPFSYRLEDGAPCHHMAVVRGEKMPPGAITASQAWIAHHVFRSAGEALMKAARGSAIFPAHIEQADRLDTIVTLFTALARKPGLVTDERTVACAPGFDDARRDLLAIPGVASCDRSIKQAFAERLGEISRQFLDTQSSETQAAFKSILAEQQ